ncbi:DedA family protein (plasmid) [Arthrobacter sp. FW306-05-C]|uniref:DedA family protein n=1 Tax=Micrococcaceae TaxID=1268 RepID=UPI001EF0D89F|nr:MULTISPECIES: DedA family protein [unclassified Arthrobacter]MDZ4351735.1 DedA family protein [Arthrobacter sp.]UKA69039.1 DedA family protein [Arthrobacter sp. FW306-05-C]UKA73350.1 DedA family protein [Arthrobacter sp. FW306-06-A]
MGQIVDSILNISPVLAALLVFALVFAEDAFFLGFVIPGETAAILGGVLASHGRLPLWVVIVLVVTAAITGDTVGYEVGRFFGPRIMRLRLVARKGQQVAKAQDLLRRRGGAAVFVGRFTAFFRAVMPALAGMAHMPYLRFLAFNAAGALVWGTGCALLGFLAGNSYQSIARTAGHGAALLTVAVVLAALLFWHLRRRRAAKAAPEAGS